MNRILYLDNLRALMIVFMVAGHGIHPYKLDGGQLTLFPDPTSCSVYNILSELGMSFRMPMLFFISAFFLMRALEVKSVNHVLRDRMFRLGVPFCLGYLFICPLVILEEQLLGGHNQLPIAFNGTQFIQLLIERFWEGKLVFHMWFLSALLVINIFTILLWQQRTLFKPIIKRLIPFRYAVFVLTFVGAIGFMTWQHYLHGKFHFIRFNPFFMVFAMPTASNLIAYSMGLITYRFDLLSKIPNQISSAWLLLLIGVYAMHYEVWSFSFYVHQEQNLFVSLLYGTSQAISNILMCIFFLTFAKSVMNCTLPLFSKLRTHSFAIYWVHFPLPHLFHAFLRHSSLPHYLKYIIVVTGSLTLSYLISMLVIRRLPVIGDALYGSFHRSSTKTIPNRLAIAAN